MFREKEQNSLSCSLEKFQVKNLNKHSNVLLIHHISYLFITIVTSLIRPTYIYIGTINIAQNKHYIIYKSPLLVKKIYEKQSETQFCMSHLRDQSNVYICLYNFELCTQHIMKRTTTNNNSRHSANLTFQFEKWQYLLPLFQSSQAEARSGMWTFRVVMLCCIFLLSVLSG